MPSVDWEIVPYRGIDGLEQLKEDWQGLYDALPFRSAFHTFGATSVYARHLSPSPESFTCFALSDGARIRAICPLERSTQWLLGAQVAVWRLPQHLHWPIADAICPDGEPRRQLVPRLVEHLRATPGSPSILALGPAPEYSALWEGLGELSASEYCTHLGWRSHVMNCQRSFDVLMSEMHKSGRRKMRKAHRLLEQLEGVRFVNATTLSELEADFESFLAVEASGWKGPTGSGTAVACSPELVAFYRDLMTTLAAHSQCVIRTIHAEGGCIAAEFCVLGTEECITLKVGYDERYSYLMPGKLAFEAGLRRCCENEDIERLNALTQVDWLARWGAVSVDVEQAHVALAGLRGRTLVAMFRLQWALRELRNRSRSQREARSSSSASPDAQ